ncbi:MAG: L-erythro-3,5-diaminohexanoate dehydrogenase [Bdellovibrionales bacterium]|nr:L-erythro-3,5-diaminohexanoate dehydrogenase [Bdellovibrionales bacterium]
MQREDSLRHGLGIHRVLEPVGALPQQALRLSADLPINDHEVLIDVASLNVDSASFHQFYQAAGEDAAAAGAAMLKVIRERGKLQNPVTGSGGMLIGTVREVGKRVSNPDLARLRPGDRVATLVSLTLTPLQVRAIRRVIPGIDRVEVDGHAILFDSGIAAKIPDDLPEGLVLATLDVAGAPAQVARLVKPGMNVAVVGGGGKSGLLCLYQAKKTLGGTGKTLAFEYSPKNCERLRQLSFVDHVVEGNAQHAVEASEKVVHALGGKADLVINVANVPGTEMASILCCKNGGAVYLFSMATSFSAAALGAEGVGADVSLMIGNGYTAGHADLALQILRESAEIRALFEALYV